MIVNVFAKFPTVISNYLLTGDSLSRNNNNATLLGVTNAPTYTVNTHSCTDDKTLRSLLFRCDNVWKFRIQLNPIRCEVA